MTAGDTLSRFADRLNGSSQMSVRLNSARPKSAMPEPRAHPTRLHPNCGALNLARARMRVRPGLVRVRSPAAPLRVRPHVRPHASLCRADKASVRHLLLSPRDCIRQVLHRPVHRFCEGMRSSREINHSFTAHRDTTAPLFKLRAKRRPSHEEDTRKHEGLRSLPDSARYSHHCPVHRAFALGRSFPAGGVLTKRVGGLVRNRASEHPRVLPSGGTGTLERGIPSAHRTPARPHA